MYYCYLPTMIGDLLLAGTASALHVLSFPEGPRRRELLALLDSEAVAP